MTTIEHHADVDHVHGMLYIGSHPFPQTLRRGSPFHPNIDVLVACARERNVEADQHTDVVVRHFSIMDNGPPAEHEYWRAVEAAQFVHEQLTAGKNVLVTCLAGINRSAWVCGWALRHQGLDAKEAIKLLRRARGNHLLSNEFFEALVLSDKHPMAKP
jgi:protein-tyrosine phosphatase